MSEHKTKETSPIFIEIAQIVSLIVLFFIWSNPLRIF